MEGRQTKGKVLLLPYRRAVNHPDNPAKNPGRDAIHTGEGRGLGASSRRNATL